MFGSLKLRRTRFAVKLSAEAVAREAGEALAW
jgi:hypothetical protein